jgi:DNA-binding PadR family transcriptional regulator
MSDKHAILGLLNRDELYGYQITKCLEDISPFWYIYPGNIYKALLSLRKSGFVETVKTVHANGLDRKIYRITQKGRVEYNRWLSQPSKPPKYRLEVLLKIWLAEKEGKFDVAETQLLERRKQVQSWKDKLVEKKESLRASSATSWTVENGLRHALADLEWVDYCLDELRRMRMPEKSYASPHKKGV